MNTIREQKNAIRTKYKERRRALNRLEKKERDLALCKKVMTLASYRYAEIILAYFPLQDEIDITYLLEEAKNQGKKIAFPRCNMATSTMTFHYVSSFSQMDKGAMGICEPSSALPEFSPDEALTFPTLCLVPALVYDKKGYRLGYGKGFYDRFLPTLKGAKVGLIYSDFIIESVPRGKFDLCVDVLVTEKGVKTTNAD